MPRDAFEEMLGRLSPHRFVDRIPASLQPWLLPIEWDRERLWSLDLPRRRMLVEELRWHFELPWWRRHDEWFQVSPHEVQAQPSAHPEHAERIARADLTYPLHVVRRRHRWLILDGIHRLTKADVLGDEYVQVSTLSPRDIAAIVQPDG